MDIMTTWDRRSKDAARERIAHFQTTRFETSGQHPPGSARLAWNRHMRDIPAPTVDLRSAVLTVMTHFRVKNSCVRQEITSAGAQNAVVASLRQAQPARNVLRCVRA